MAPIGIRTLVFFSHNLRQTFQAHVMNTWHIGPVIELYHLPPFLIQSQGTVPTAAHTSYSQYNALFL